MRAAGWTVSGVGAGVGAIVIAYAFLGATFTDGPESSAGGDHARMVLVGVTIAAVALCVGAALRRTEQWATYVFIGLASLLAISAVWWAVGELLG